MEGSSRPPPPSTARSLAVAGISARRVAALAVRGAEFAFLGFAFYVIFIDFDLLLKHIHWLLPPLGITGMVLIGAEWLIRRLYFGPEPGDDDG
jgi:hypothetical protein